MLRLAVTGSSGYLGRAVVRALEADPEVERIIGLDIVPGPESAKVHSVQMDVRDPAMGALLKAERVDGILHLAFIIEPGGRPALMRDVNVNGTRNVLRAAAEAGVNRFLLMSSLAVYGAWPDNPPRLTEDLPPRPNPDDDYGQHKLQAEWLCRLFAEEHPEVAVAIMRPCGIVGPSFKPPFLRALQRAPFLPLPRECRGKAQFIHEDDAARLAVLLTKTRARGTFNAADENTLDWRAVYARLGKPIVALPGWLLRQVLQVAWRIRMLPVLPVQMRLISCPVVLCGERARRLLGFLPRYSTAHALESVLLRP